MKTPRINRQAIVRTCRLHLPAVCLSLLAACVAKPIEQDLASGDATVEIKYLDSVTMDIVDDTRTKRRKFYEEALDERDKKYSQGQQGAIDRVSTIAAAINANAQGDKSVLERYRAEGDRQLAALDNSKELNDALLDHNKQVIKDTDFLNAAKVQAAAAQAGSVEKLAEINTEAASSMLDEYRSALTNFNESISAVDEKLARKKELEALTKKEPDNSALKDELSSLADITAETKNDLISKKIDLLKEMRGFGFTATGEYGMLVKKDTGNNSAEMSISGSSLTPQNLVSELDSELVPIRDKDGSVVKDKDGNPLYSKKIRVASLPQAEAPTSVQYLADALTGLDSIKDKLSNLADANTDETVRRVRGLSAPPIERIRNDEAVFDYLLDGYRNTQISSGAEYGGMVRRVLPFSFTFTPGKNTRSGFSARVLLQPDQQQINDAARMIALHLNAETKYRVKNYVHALTTMQRTKKVIDTLLVQNYDNSCSAINVEEDEKSFPLDIFRFSDDEIRKKAFWKAYGESLDAIMNSLKDNLNGKQKALYGWSLYQYDLSKITDALAGKAKKIMTENENGGAGPSHQANEEKRLKNPRSILFLADPADVKYYEYSSMSAACSLNRMLNGKLVKFKKEKRWLVEDFISEIDKLAVAMTSAGLVYDLHLKANPLFLGKGKGIIDVVSDGVVYQTVINQVDDVDIKNIAASSAAPRIVQNTSREQVVEIPDTAKMNTFLSAAATGNQVASQLGLTLGAELAAAISSSSAFIKRIPYAVPFTGQTFTAASSAKKACTSEKDLKQCGEGGSPSSCVCNYENQSFGWRFYKTPAGATQMGGIVQSFKTTPVNSAVIVSMPEWISKLKATYQLSEDAGKTWRTVGGEDITLAGASLRGALDSDVSPSFDAWVKYNLYREVDGSIGLPQLKSCYGDGGGNNIIYGNSSGYTALCGENLYGVKAVLVGGRYVDDIEKVSSSLIKVRSLRLGPEECNSDSCGNNDKCRIVLLSDFGASSSEKEYCLNFSYSGEAENDESDLSSLAMPDVSLSGDNIMIKFTNHGINGFKVNSYRIGEQGGYNSYLAEGINEEKDNLVKDNCMKNKNNKCNINIYGRVAIGKKELSGLIGKIDMDSRGLWQPYGENFQYPVVQETRCNVNESKCEINIKYVSRSIKIAGSYSLRIGTSQWFDVTDSKLTCEDNVEGSEELSCSPSITDIKKWCKNQKKNCRVEFQYKNDKAQDAGFLKLDDE